MVVLMSLIFYCIGFLVASFIEKVKHDDYD